MDENSFISSDAGRLVRLDGRYVAFVPAPLPPKLTLEPVIGPLSDADRALGHLEGMGKRLPNPHLLIRPLLRREAVLSSRIEGTQASLSDLFLFEAEPTTERGDVREVRDYVRAMEHGIRRLKGLPLSLRLIGELHSKLMRGARGGKRTAGEFRQTQNWIGPRGCHLENARFVPPPVEAMRDCLEKFEKYLHATPKIPVLLDVALVHYQFETIHPFLDGNGRVGRLLISLMLHERGVLSQPLLYLSASFERHRTRYYDLLLKVSQEGAFIEWIKFFLESVRMESMDAVNRIDRLTSLQHEYHERIQEARTSSLLVKLVDSLFARPALTVKQAMRITGTTYLSAQRSIQKLENQKILREYTGKKRNRLYVAEEILQLLDAPTSQR